jgi:hypothetical protein
MTTFDHRAIEKARAAAARFLADVDATPNDSGLVAGA